MNYVGAEKPVDFQIRIGSHVPINSFSYPTPFFFVPRISRLILASKLQKIKNGDGRGRK